MEQEQYYIKVSPESLLTNISQQTLSGVTFGVYSAMTALLSGGTNGDSLLTGLTIPILFTQKFNDIGFYSPFDGFILQKDVVNNFVYSGNPSSVYQLLLYNTSSQFKKFLQLSSYEVDWGDGTTNIITTTSPNAVSHTYPPTPSGYTVTLTQTNPWGITQVSQTVQSPFSGVTISNPQGNITFTPQGGNWSGIPLNYDFIFTGDSENVVSQQTSNNFTSVPFVVTGYTSSKLDELKLYGTVKYDPSVIVKKFGQDYGQVLSINPSYTSYTIDNVTYFDYANGKTVFVLNSSGLTSNMLVATGITKEEVLMNVVDSPEIQSEIFIQRGKNSAFEALQRIGEVDNLGDLVRYGYGFFKINEQ